MKQKSTMIIIALVIMATASIVLVFAKQNSGDPFQNYEFYSVQRRDLSETIDATGKVLALEKKDLYADYEGAVEAINVKSGDYVKEGDIILTIKSAVLKDQWRETEAELKQAELNFAQASALLTTELALNQVQKANAIQLESYTHQVSLYKQQISQAKSRLNALKEKNDGYYMADNEKLFIRAPFTGKVAWINIQPGERVTPQTLLGTVIKPDAIGVEAQIDQNDINLVKPGQKAIVTGKDETQSENAGLVHEISILGTESDEVVNFPVRIKLNGIPKGLQPGMEVDVTVLAEEHPNVLAIPAGSIIQKDGRDLVQVKQGDRLVTVPVELGLKQGKYYQVQSGLKEGDKVAVAKPDVAKGSAGTNRGAGMRMPGLRR